MGSRPQPPPLLSFFFNDTATTEIYTLSLHDALPISRPGHRRPAGPPSQHEHGRAGRSEEHTSELQSPYDLVCRLMLEKNKQVLYTIHLSKKHNKNNIIIQQTTTR